MNPTVEDLIKMNNDALKVLNGSFETLKNSLAGQDPEEKARILARMGRITNEVNATSNVLIHLHAAEVVIDPISEDLQQRLDELAAALDDAIMRQAWVDATLDIVQSLFDAASQVRKITDANTHSN